MHKVSAYPSGVSIVICCFNSRERLPDTLKHLAEQNLDFKGKTELIIVDNNSSDDTSQVAQDLWSDFGNPFPQHVIFEKRQGIAFARQSGIAKSQYALIAFVDDDNWLEKSYLKQAFDLMYSNENVAVLGGSNIGTFDVEPPVWMDQPFPFNSLRHSLAIHNEEEQRGTLRAEEYVFGAGSVYRRYTLDELQELGFTPILSGRQKNILTSGDDEELCYALRMLGYKVMRNPQMKLQHYIPSGRLSWAYYKRMFYGYGFMTPVTGLYKYFLSHDQLPSTNISQRLKTLKLKLRILEWLDGLGQFLLRRKKLKTALLIEKIKGEIAYLTDPENPSERHRKILQTFIQRIKESQTSRHH